MVWRRGRRDPDVDAPAPQPPRALDLLFEPQPTSVRPAADAGGPDDAALDPRAPQREPVFARRHIEALVTTVYRLLLRRDPDSRGLYDHSDRLHDDATLAGVETLLRHVTSSPEYDRQATLQACDLVLRRDVAPVYGPVHHLIALDARAAWLAGACELRRWTGPFDGALASPEMVVCCLEDDFAAFVKPGQLAAVQPGHSGTHRLFQDPAQLAAGAEPLLDRDPTLPEQRAHYERCVARLGRALQGADAKCLVMLPDWPAEHTDAALEELHDRLHAAIAARTTNFRLLLVGVDDASPGPSHALRELPGRDGALFRFHASSARHPRTGFAQAWDDAALKRLLWRNAYDLRGEP